MAALNGSELSNDKPYNRIYPWRLQLGRRFNHMGFGNVRPNSAGFSVPRKSPTGSVARLAGNRPDVDGYVIKSRHSPLGE